MGVISGQSSQVCAGSCRVQKTEIIDRTLLGLSPPLILITEAPRCLQTYSVLSLHSHHFSANIYILKIIPFSRPSRKTHKETVGVVLKRLPLCLFLSWPLLYRSFTLPGTLELQRSSSRASLFMSWHGGWYHLVLHLWQAVEAGQVI